MDIQFPKRDRDIAISNRDFVMSDLDRGISDFEFAISTFEGGNNLAWNSVSNWTYRVQYKTNLTDANWTDLPGDVLATNVISSKTDVAVPTQCFYRLLLLW